MQRIFSEPAMAFSGSGTGEEQNLKVKGYQTHDHTSLWSRVTYFFMQISLLLATITVMICSLKGFRIGDSILRTTELAKVRIFGRDMFIKRDDQNFHVSGLNGNKGRKLMSLLSTNTQSSTIVSYGGVQSNSLLALSRIAFYKRKKLRYITTQISPQLKSNPTGNYKLALSGGTEVRFDVICHRR